MKNLCQTSNNNYPNLNGMNGFNPEYRTPLIEQVSFICLIIDIDAIFFACVCMYVCVVYMALVNTVILCARSQYFTSASLRGIATHLAFFIRILNA